MSMIERQLYTIIVGDENTPGSFAWFKADDGSRFERFLIDECELSATEAAGAKLFFAGGLDPDGNTIEARPPTLQHGYPRQGGPFPCWSIVLGGENEIETYLGEDAPLPVDDDDESMMLLDPETGQVVDPKIRRVSYVHNIQVIAEHPDVTLYYYHLLKRILLSQHEHFIAADLGTPTINGMDLLPDPRYLPETVFARQLSVVIEAEECWTEARSDGYGNTVSGIAVNDGSDAAEAANAQVTSYTE